MHYPPQSWSHDHVKCSKVPSDPHIPPHERCWALYDWWRCTQGWCLEIETCSVNTFGIHVNMCIAEFVCLVVSLVPVRHKLLSSWCQAMNILTLIMCSEYTTTQWLYKHIGDTLQPSSVPILQSSQYLSLFTRTFTEYRLYPLHLLYNCHWRGSQLLFYTDCCEYRICKIRNSS